MEGEFVDVKGTENEGKQGGMWSRREAVLDEHDVQV